LNNFEFGIHLSTKEQVCDGSLVDELGMWHIAVWNRVLYHAVNNWNPSNQHMIIQFGMLEHGGDLHKCEYWEGSDHYHADEAEQIFNANHAWTTETMVHSICGSPTPPRRINGNFDITIRHYLTFLAVACIIFLWSD
jgi:hypothetical protein